MLISVLRNSSISNVVWLVWNRMLLSWLLQFVPWNTTAAFRRQRHPYQILKHWRKVLSTLRSILRTFRNTAFRLSLHWTLSSQILKMRFISSRTSVKKEAVNLHFPKSGRKAARAASHWLRRYSIPLSIRRVILKYFMRTACLWKRRLKQLPKRFTVQQPLLMHLLQKKHWRKLQKWDLAMCLSAWRRISIHYPMILSFWVDLKTSMSISVKFMYLQVQDL